MNLTVFIDRCPLGSDGSIIAPSDSTCASERRRNNETGSSTANDGDFIYDGCFGGILSRLYGFRSSRDPRLTEQQFPQRPQ